MSQWQLFFLDAFHGKSLLAVGLALEGKEKC